MPQAGGLRRNLQKHRRAQRPETCTRQPAGNQMCLPAAEIN
jgi:hypothetical protein